MLFLVVLVFVTSLTCWALLRIKNGHFYELASKIPGPPTIPILGNSRSLAKHPNGLLYYFVHNVNTYGSVVRIWIGNSLRVLLTDPNDVEILLKDTRNIKKASSYDYILPWLGQGLITSSGEHWFQHRKAITPAFHFNILERFVEVFNEQGKVLVANFKKNVGKGTFDVFPYIAKYTMDAILETSMGVQLNIQRKEKLPDYVVAINTLEEIIHYRGFNIFLQPDIVFSLTKYAKKQRDALNLVHGYCAKVMEERKKNLKDVNFDDLTKSDDLGRKKKRLAFLDMLLFMQQKDGIFTDKDISHEVSTFLFAGHDTTTTAISFTLYCLAKHQDVQQRLYEEIVELFGEDEEEISMKDLQKTKYLDMVIKESLRLFPPVPNYSRLLDHDLQLTKYTIPAGTSISTFTYMCHRNPEYFPDPEKFDPERFSAENSRKMHPFAFVPFSAGLRNCIGQKYAMLEIKYTLIELLKNFKILFGSELTTLNIFVILSSINGINIKVENRK